jgi:hypothetical protein
VFHLLGQISDSLSCCLDHPALIRGLPSGYQVQDGGFACAVTTHQSDAVTRVYLETDPVKQDEGSKSNAYIVNGYHSPAKIEQFIDSIV